MELIGLAVIVYLFSLVFKYSFTSGFFIWLFLLIIGSIIEEQEKKDLAEQEAKENELLSTRPCPTCAERIKIAAKKCRYCSELI